jgi:hypothetical protein
MLATQMKVLLSSRVLVFFSFFILLLPSAKAESSPSTEIIANWWKAASKEKIDLLGKPIQIRLRDKEIAYLVEASFDRGRNDMFGTVIVRPRLQEVREVAEPVRIEIKVFDLDRDGVSEVIAKSVGSGQGTESGVRSIVQFDGWNAIVLHQAEFESACAPDLSSCSSTKISWKFSDLDNDGKLDLIEDTISSEGETNKPATISKVVRRFIFKNGKFTPHDSRSNETNK